MTEKTENDKRIPLGFKLAPEDAETFFGIVAREDRPQITVFLRMMKSYLDNLESTNG